MYIAGFVIPVPEEKMEAYRKWAENGAAIFRPKFSLANCTSR